MTGRLDGEALPTPALPRRLACFVYEGVLLFGVVFATGFVYAVATRQQHARIGRDGLLVVLLFVLCAYFLWFWTRAGQTLAMQTWRIRLLTRGGAPVSKLRALCRFILSWLWFLPALVTIWLTGLLATSPTLAGLLVVFGVLAYAALAWLNPQGQYLHDTICGTRLVSWQPPQRDLSAT